MGFSRVYRLCHPFVHILHGTLWIWSFQFRTLPPESVFGQIFKHLAIPVRKEVVRSKTSVATHASLDAPDAVAGIQSGSLSAKVSPESHIMRSHRIRFWRGAVRVRSGCILACSIKDSFVAFYEMPDVNRGTRRLTSEIFLWRIMRICLRARAHFRPYTTANTATLGLLRLVWHELPRPLKFFVILGIPKSKQSNVDVTLTTGTTRSWNTL